MRIYVTCVTIMIMNENKKLKDIRFSTSVVKTNSGIFVKKYKQKNKRYVYLYKEVLININDLYIKTKCLTTKQFYDMKNEVSEEDIEIMKTAITHYLSEFVDTDIHVININNSKYEKYFKIDFGIKYLLSDIQNVTIQSLLDKDNIISLLRKIERDLIFYDGSLMDNINAEYLLNGKQIFPDQEQFYNNEKEGIQNNGTHR